MPLLHQREQKWFGAGEFIGMPLFCFPYAGGTAATYRRWQNLRSFGVTVVPVLLPGREARLCEPAHHYLPGLIDAIFEGLKHRLPARFAFFGHSMGAILAFELARKLQASSYPSPEMLLVSGRGAPHLQGSLESWHELPDADFLARLAEGNESLNEVMAHPELIEILIPTLRADFELCATYQYQPGLALRSSIIAYGGSEDKDVPEEALAAWRAYTLGRFEYRLFPGDHWYLHPSAVKLQQHIGMNCTSRW